MSIYIHRHTRIHRETDTSTNKQGSLKASSARANIDQLRTTADTSCMMPVCITMESQSRPTSLVSLLQLVQSNESSSSHSNSLELNSKQTLLGLSISIQLPLKPVNVFTFFLKQLKRAGVPTDQLVHFYVAVIRPVLEYFTPVWHYDITHTQTEQIESIQKRAIRIIFPLTREISYPYALSLFAANLNSLHSRRYDISKSFFQDICDQSSCIHQIRPTRDTSVLSRLRTVTRLPRLSFRTKKHCSFIIYALNNYQESIKLTQNSTLPT